MWRFPKTSTLMQIVLVFSCLRFHSPIEQSCSKLKFYMQLEYFRDVIFKFSCFQLEFWAFFWLDIFWMKLYLLTTLSQFCMLVSDEISCDRFWKYVHKMVTSVSPTIFFVAKVMHFFTLYILTLTSQFTRKLSIFRVASCM